MHFRRGRTIRSNLAPTQMNVRHGERIVRSVQGPARPGRYRVQMIAADANHGAVACECPQGLTGLNVEATANGAPAGVIVVGDPGGNIARLVDDLYGLGNNPSGNLFRQPNAVHSPNGGLGTSQAQDPSTFMPDPQSGQGRALFTGATWDNTQPYSESYSYAEDGSLYDPFTEHGGDIVNTPGFYQP